MADAPISLDALPWTTDLVDSSGDQIDYVAALEAEQNNVNGLLLELLTLGYEQYDCVVAVEGVDDKKFYFDFVKHELSGFSFSIMECGGKSSLFRFKEAVERYQWVDPPKFKYLCDKDFDDYLCIKDPDIWYTPYYSIESYFARPDFVEYSVEKHASRNLSIAQIKALSQAYVVTLQDLALRLRPLSALFCEVRAGGVHPCFDDVTLDKIFRFEGKKLRKKMGLYDSLIALLKIEKAPDFSSLIVRARQFAGPEAFWLRGKLLLQLARKAYDSAVEEAPASSRKHFPSTSFMGGDAFHSYRTFAGSLGGLGAYLRA
jgi:hypothetical protein